MTNNGKITNIDENVSLYGRIFGTITGSLLYIYIYIDIWLIYSGEIEYEIYDLDEAKI